MHKVKKSLCFLFKLRSHWHVKSHRQMNWSVQQAAYLDAWISTISNSNNLKGHILHIISSPSDIWRLPRHAAFTGDFTAGDFFKPCASLPNWPRRRMEWPPWNISSCFLWQAIILVCQIAKSVVACLKVIRPCLDSLQGEALSQCLYIHICKCTKHKPPKNECNNSHAWEHIWPCLALTQLRCIQTGILQSRL